ncbi:hypothetical protein BaRGS_00011526 [Batillaria attramentaria]|uniref:Peptidase S1 domain-containing protein n=1 Tax=Batillaria attramentaria TaxID=370345 RepID=A0ABD0LE17_9CAEN
MCKLCRSDGPYVVQQRLAAQHSQSRFTYSLTQSTQLDGNVTDTMQVLFLVAVLAFTPSIGTSRDFQAGTENERAAGVLEDLNTSEEKLLRHKRIVEGQEVTQGSWPWLVALGRTGSDGTKYIYCGAVVYDSRHVITAQHCVREHPSSKLIPTRDLYVVAGEHHLKVKDYTEQERSVRNVFVHADYEERTQNNDVALLELASPLALTPGQVENLPVNGDGGCPTVGQKCRVAGWGKPSKYGRRSYVPLETTVEVISNSKCGSLYGTTLHAGKMCAGTGGPDTCTGDSGGPLVCECGGWSVVAGVVSYGRGCGSASHPGVYTRLSQFQSWIRDVAAMSWW